MFKKLIFSVLALCMLPIQAFLSYAILEKNGKKIFLAGLEQSNESFKALAQTHAIKFIDFIRLYNSMAKIPVTCFYEGTDSETLGENIRAHKGDPLKYDIIVAQLMLYQKALVEKGLQKNSTFRLQNYEPRIHKASDDVNAFFYAVETLIDNLQPQEKLKTKWQKNKQKIKKKKSLVTIKQYYDMLDSWIEQIKKWEGMIWNDSTLRKYMRKLNTAFKQSIENVKEKLHGYDLNTKLTFALMSLLEQTTTKEAAQELFKELATELRENIDYRFAQLGFFTKTILDQQKHDVTLFLVGHGHIVSLAQMFEQYGYKIIKSRHPVDMGDGNIMVLPDFTSDFFAQLYNLFLPASQKITETDLRTERIKVAVVCVACGTRQTAQLQLKVCAGCKTVSYCSADCQKKDWKQHKTECKKLLGKQ